MKINPPSIALIFCLACQAPGTSHDQRKNETDSNLNQPKSGDSSSLTSKKDLSFSKQLQFRGISFHVYSPNNTLHNSIIIQPSGLKDNSFVQTGVIGNVGDAFIGDLNKDGFPELYYTAMTGNGHKNLFGYGSNKNKNLSPVYVQDINDLKWGTGYKGGDDYKFSGDELIRSFPVFAPTDPANSPSGGTRELHYRLVPAVNGWLLKIVDARDKH